MDELSFFRNFLSITKIDNDDWNTNSDNQDDLKRALNLPSDYKFPNRYSALWADTKLPTICNCGLPFKTSLKSNSKTIMARPNMRYSQYYFDGKLICINVITLQCNNNKANCTFGKKGYRHFSLIPIEFRN